MSQEYVTYKGMPSVTSSTCDVQKQLELQRWIIDPDSRPYDSRDRNTELIARSAGSTAVVAEARDKSSVQKQLELQQMILGTYYG